MKLDVTISPIGKPELVSIIDNTAYPLDNNELKTILNKLETLEKLHKAAARVRKCQNEYYTEPKGSKRKRAKLIASKEAEKDLDNLLETIENL